MKTLVVISLLLTVQSQVFAGQIALSFDDASRRTTSYFKGNERSERLIQGLKDAKVERAIFFATTQGLEDPKRRARLKAYANAGHIIGNHTHTHERPDEIGVENYIADIKKAHSKLKHIKNFAPIFRYPYLDYGKKSLLEIALEKNLNPWVTPMGMSLWTMPTGIWMLSFREL